MAPRLAIIGDSFVEGVGDPERLGWAVRLQNQTPSIGDVTVSGIGGNNIRHVLNRLWDDALRVQPTTLIIQVGANDSRLRPSLGFSNEVPLGEFEAALESLDLFSRRCAVARMVVLGLCPVDEGRTNPFKEDKIYLNAELRRYDAVIRRFTHVKGHSFVDLRYLFDADGGPNDLTADGLHPNGRGHQVIADAVLASINGRHDFT